MSAALATSTFAVARKLSGPSRLPRRRTAVQAVASSEGLNADSCVVGMAVARRAGLALGATAASLATVAPPAYAMEGVLSVFNGNPALTLGMAVLQKKEAAGRAWLAEAGVDTSDIEQGNWGRVLMRIKDEAARQGIETPKF